MLDNLLKTIPPVTRTIAFLLALGTVPVTQDTCIIMTCIFQRFQNSIRTGAFLIMQVWRLVTSLFVVKDFDTGSAYRSLVLYLCDDIVYMFQARFKRTGSKGVALIICTSFASICQLFTASLLGWASAPCLEFYLNSLTYYFARVHNDMMIFINLIPIRAPYCIWFISAFEWLQGDNSLTTI